MSAHKMFGMPHTVQRGHGAAHNGLSTGGTHLFQHAQVVLKAIKLAFVLSAISALELLVANLALVMLRMDVLSLNLKVLSNNGLLAHRARMLLGVVIDETLGKASGAKWIAFQIQFVLYTLGDQRRSTSRANEVIWMKSAPLVLHSCCDALVLDHALAIEAARCKHVVIIIGTVKLLLLFHKLNTDKGLVAFAASKTFGVMRLRIHIENFSNDHLATSHTVGTSEFDLTA